MRPFVWLRIWPPAADKNHFMIGVIADDLTGAAELGAVGLRHGLRSEIVLIGQPSGKADIVCVDTDSRAQTAVEAARRATAAATMLRRAGADWIYKKVDSVLRGQVIAEIEAVMLQLRLQRTLLLPANPSLGRTIQDGKYFIRGRLIHKTDFAKDPQYPRRSARVLELLKTPQHFSIGLGKLAGPISTEGIVVAEASSSAAVRQWAARREAGTLMAGGAEFFGALLAMEPGVKPPRTPKTVAANGAGREFFISGSSSSAARKFTTAARRNKTPVFSLPQELAWGAELLPMVATNLGQRIVTAFGSHSRVLLTVGLPLVRDVEVSERLSGHVVQIAESALRQVDVGRVYADGGATAVELVRRMGWPRLEVVRELAPGVATLAIAGKKSMLLTIKPGSYAWPAQWTGQGAI